MRSPYRFPLPGLIVVLAACQAPPAPPPPASAAPAPSAVTTASPAITTTPAPPAVLPLNGAAAFAATGPASQPLSAAGETAVEPGASFRVELPLSLPDARLALIDGGDAMVAAAGARQVGAATVLTLAPATPLVTGARYRLRVDGVASRELHAADGRRFSPLEWLVVVPGAPEPKKAPGRKAKRR